MGQGPDSEGEGGSEAAPEADELVCFHPRDDAPGVVVRGVTEGEVESEAPLVADGEDRPVERGGCEGVERAHWSEDGKRLYIRSEWDCGADVSRVQTSVLAFHDAQGWMEVQAVEAGESDPAAGVRHFQAVDPTTVEAVGLPVPTRDHELALETARQAATASVTAEHVQEAVQRVHPEAVKALILETDARIPLDAETLVALDDAGVPGSLVDLMVAMDNPHRFQLDRNARTVIGTIQERPESPVRAPYPVLTSHRVYGSYGFRFSSPYPYHFRSAYGLGARFGGTYGSFGPVVVVPVEPRSGGQVSFGEGYTQGHGEASTGRRAVRTGPGASAVSRDRPGTTSTSVRSSGSSRVTSSGATRGGSSSDDRRARSRSGGGGDGGS